MEHIQIRHAAIPSLKRLVTVAKRDTGQSGIVARFLLAMYNGHDYPVDLNDLRGLDEHLFDDCLEVLKLNYLGKYEIHEYLDGGQAIFKSLADYWRPE